MAVRAPARVLVRRAGGPTGRMSAWAALRIRSVFQAGWCRWYVHRCLVLHFKSFCTHFHFHIHLALFFVLLSFLCFDVSLFYFYLFVCFSFVFRYFSVVEFFLGVANCFCYCLWVWFMQMRRSLREVATCLPTACLPALHCLLMCLACCLLPAAAWSWQHGSVRFRTGQDRETARTRGAEKSAATCFAFSSFLLQCPGKNC